MHRIMVARFQGRLRPINSNKEIVDSTLLAVAAATQSVTSVLATVNDYTGVVGTCPLGAKVTSIFLFVQVLPTTGTANTDMAVLKSPNALIVPVAGAIGGTTMRKYVLHEEKGIPGNAADGAYPMTFKGVIRIPKGRQRMAEGDSIRVLTRGTDIHNACIKAIFKWYI